MKGVFQGLNSAKDIIGEECFLSCDAAYHRGLIVMLLLFWGALILTFFYIQSVDLPLFIARNIAKEHTRRDISLMVIMSPYPLTRSCFLPQNY